MSGSVSDARGFLAGRGGLWVCIVGVALLGGGALAAMLWFREAAEPVVREVLPWARRHHHANRPDDYGYAVWSVGLSTASALVLMLMAAFAPAKVSRRLDRFVRRQIVDGLKRSAWSWGRGK